jgi:hypothetical protein
MALGIAMGWPGDTTKAEIALSVQNFPHQRGKMLQRVAVVGWVEGGLVPGLAKMHAGLIVGVIAVLVPLVAVAAQMMGVIVFLE